MRHNKKLSHLSRTSSHRKAMLANMASSLIKYKRINTTTAKAKALRGYVEPLITKSKNDTTHSRRIVFSYLKDKYAVTELFKEISQKVADRPGGYTRIIKTGYRLGDNAQMCFIELVDYNENMLKETSAKKSTRTRRSKKKADGTDVAPAPKVKEEKVEVKSPEVVEEVAEPKAEVEVIEEAAPEATAEVVEEVVEATAEATAVEEASEDKKEEE